SAPAIGTEELTCLAEGQSEDPIRMSFELADPRRLIAAPQSQGAIVSRGKEQSILAKKPNRVDRTDVTAMNGARLQLHRVEDAHLAVVTCHRERPAVRADAEGENGAREAQLFSLLLSRDNVPAFHGSVDAPAKETPAVRR